MTPTQTKKTAFLDAYATNGNIRAAAHIAGIDRRTHYKWLDTDKKYVEAFQEALDDFCDRLRHEAARRALQGVKHDVYYQGQVVGQELEYSDRILELLL